MSTTTALPANEDDGPGILALTWVEAIIALSLVAARTYTRAVIVRRVGIDDWIMIFTAALCIVMSALVTVAVHDGFGKHAVYVVPATDLVGAIKYFWLASPFAIMSTCFGKISIALLLMRIVNRNRLYIVILWTIIVMLLAVHIVVIAVNFSQCVPANWLWEQFSTTTTETGTCPLPKEVQIKYGYFQGAFAGFTDLILALFPILLIKELQMDLKLKIGLCAAMALGLLATVAAINKTIELSTLAGADFTWDGRALMYWFVTESWVIVIAACIPTLAPLYFVLIGQRTARSYAMGPDGGNSGSHARWWMWPRSLGGTRGSKVRGSSARPTEGSQLEYQPLSDLPKPARG